jgi:hypothetical protein
MSRGSTGATGKTGATGAQGDIGETGRAGHGVSLTSVVLVIVVPLLAYLFSSSVQEVDKLREGCERNNIRAEQFIGLLDDIIEANERRIEAPGSSSSEITANRLALESYAARKEAVLDSIDPQSSENPTHVDCELAFPKPWPLD